MMTNLQTWLITAAFGGAAALIWFGITVPRRRHRRIVLAALAPSPHVGHEVSVARLALWLGRLAPARWLIRRSNSEAGRHDRLSAAGSRWSVAELAGRSLLAAALGAAILVAAAVVLAPPLIVLAPLGALVGSRAPGLRLARTARRRSARIDAQVPELVELLVAASESGLPPPAAFVRSADALLAPLGDEVRDAAARIRLGEPWRESLDRVVDRTGSPGLAMLARSLERSHRLGASARGALHALVDELRAERRARAEERARRAPVKMLFPLVFLILPAFLLLTVGPVLLSTVRSLH
jgi:tight adherence protein C